MKINGNNVIKGYKVPEGNFEVVASGSSKNIEDGAIEKIDETLASKGYGISVKAIARDAFDSSTSPADTKTENNKLITTTTTYTYYVNKEKNATFLLKKEIVIESYAQGGNNIHETTYNLEVSKIDKVEENIAESESSVLRNVVAVWYRRFLIVAIIGMMSVLVYIGIRILLASASQQKAKYKQLLGDWFVGMILLFTMHYIMVFSNLFVDKLTDAVNEGSTITYMVVPEDKNGKIKKALEKENGVGFNIVPETSEKELEAGDVVEINSGGSKHYVLYTTLMGKLRYELQSKNDLDYGGYTILFLVAVIYLVVYSVMYLRRVIYMAFLTMIAPLVALTYPIDKANDGKAQGFDIWFKEYIFNLLIQPLHLLLYSLLISSAVRLATQNLLYAIVAMGFMAPAEKLLRKMFNFEKANTPGLFGGVAGGALLMSGMRWLMGHGPKGGSGDKKGSGSGVKTDESGAMYSVADERNKVNIPQGQDENVDIGGGGPDIGGPDIGGPDIGGPDTGGSQTGQEENELAGEDIDFLQNWKDALDEDTNRGDAEEEALEKVNAELERRAQLQQEQEQAQEQAAVDQAEEQAAEQAAEDNSVTIRGWRSGLSNSFGAYKDGMLNKFSRSLDNAKPARFMGRWGARIIGGATLGMAGIAAGTATGDASKTAQYAGMAALGGGKLGRQTFDALSRGLGVEGVSDQFQRGYLGEKEYQKRMAKKNQEIAMSNEEYIRKVQEKLKLDRNEAKKRMQEMIPFYYDNKITDISEIIKMEKAVKKDELIRDQNDKAQLKEARSRALIGHHLEQQYSISSKLEENKRKAVLERMQADYKWNTEQAKQFIRYADAYNRANNNL